ncbi:MAG: hypothetical protein ABIQ55_06850 [Gemmatimonadaceae bacterium]
MKHHFVSLLAACSALLIATGCNGAAPPEESDATQDVSLAGAWHSRIHFNGGVLGGVPDLEFLYSYNAGGTMTESSNYDEAANSSPPAYGVWRKRGPRQFETKYLFYQTRAPAPADGPGNDNAWLPAGRGVLTEAITLSADGKSYTSTIKYVSFDKSGKATTGGGEGGGVATRIVF